MSSILTNNSAMVALETLRNINMGLEDVQSQISTGKKIASASDNAAIWAISTVMSTDVTSFKQITDSLNLGASAVGVAKNAAEDITGKLQEIKDLVVSAQDESVDRATIQNDISEKIGTISSIVSAAQFNGQNLIDGSSTANMRVLGSLDRSSSGVTASYIDVTRTSLALANTGGTAEVFGSSAVTDASILGYGTASGTTTTAVSSGSPAAPTRQALANGATSYVGINAVADGNSYRVTLDDNGSSTGSENLNSIGSRSFEYVASATDSAADVAAALSQEINNFFSATGESNYAVTFNNTGELEITNNAGSGRVLGITLEAATGGTAATAVQGLGELNTLNVSNDAAGALNTINTLIDRSVAAAASYGSAQNRISDQAEFITSLTDSLTSGVGSLVDADMEAASAKLQALQVQQQLGVQALSIANQAPQTLLSLFR